MFFLPQPLFSKNFAHGKARESDGKKQRGVFFKEMALNVRLNPATAVLCHNTTYVQKLLSLSIEIS